MTATITQLSLMPSRNEIDMMLNIYDTDSSGGVNILEGIPETTYGVKNAVIVSNGDNEWVQLLNGTEPLIGPVYMDRNIPYLFSFETPVYCNTGNALVLKSESDFVVSMVLHVKIGPPMASPSASVSASPSI